MLLQREILRRGCELALRKCPLTAWGSDASSTSPSCAPSSVLPTLSHPHRPCFLSHDEQLLVLAHSFVCLPYWISLESSEPIIVCGLLSEYGNLELDWFEFSLLIFTRSYRVCMCLCEHLCVLSLWFLCGLIRSLHCMRVAPVWGLASVRFL